MHRSSDMESNRQGYLPLTNAQRWLMGELPQLERPGWVNIEFLVKTKKPIHEPLLREAVLYLMEKYENLRVRATSRGGRPLQQIFPAAESDPFESFDLSEEDAHGQQRTIRQICMHERDCLLPERGRLMRVLFFKFSPGEGRIWFCLHHLVADFVSVVSLSGELLTSYHSLLQGTPLRKKAAIEYRRWVYLLEGYIRDRLIPWQKDYWTSLPWEKAELVPTDYPEKYSSDKDITEAIRYKKLIPYYRYMDFQLEEETTFMLINRYGNDLEILLIAVFFLAIARQRKMTWMDLAVSTSGRNTLPAEYMAGLEVPTVGFMAVIRVYLLNDTGLSDTHEAIAEVMRQIRAVPGDATGYAYIGDQLSDEEERKAFKRLRRNPQILFNYLGKTGKRLNNEQYEIVDEDLGRNAYPEEIKNSLLECIAGFNEGGLHVNLCYIEDYLKPATIGNILRLMRDILHTAAEQRVAQLYQ